MIKSPPVFSAPPFLRNRAWPLKKVFLKMRKNKIRSQHIAPWPFCRFVLYVFILMSFIYGSSFAASVKTLLVISIDALHPDALGSETSKNIHHLMQQGWYTLDGHSTQPPLTLVAHAAMFSGLSPEKSGMTDNNWQTGEPGIKTETFVDTAKSKGYSTGFFYSKEKLGFLLNQAVDQHKLDPDFSVDNAMTFFKASEQKQFCFLHISGLDRTGPVEGWLSPGYLEELFFIDESIALLIEMVKSKGNYLIIITSDHAGHDTVHGTDHTDDARLPLILFSDIIDLKHYQGIKYHVTEFKPILEMLLNR